MKILLCLSALVFLSACNLTSNADVPSPLAVTPTPHVETASSATPSISSGTFEIPGVGKITSTPPIGTQTSIIETAIPVTPVETFAPMPNLGTPEKPASCTIDDYNGRIQAAERANAKPLPENAANKGWQVDRSWGIYTRFFRGTSNIVSVCKLSAKFLGYPDVQFYVVGFQVPNADNTGSSIVHAVIESKYFKANMASYANGGSLGIYDGNVPDDSLAEWAKSGEAWAVKLLKESGQINYSQYFTKELEHG